MPEKVLTTLHYEDFARHVNSKFRVQLDADAMIEMTLINVEDRSPSPRHEQFALTFKAPVDAPPHQGIYQLEHEQLGSGAIFLVPISKDLSGITYEAIFNRKRGTPQ